MKEYLSASRYAKAKFCKLYGLWLTRGGSPFAHSGMKKGNQVHSLIEAYYKSHLADGAEAVDISEILSRVLPDPRTITIEDVDTQKYTKYTDNGLECIGYIDLLTSDTVFDWKTGKEQRPEYIDQIKFYMWLTSKTKGQVVYVDTGEVIHVTEPATDAEIDEVWRMILDDPIAERSHLCKGCHLKRDCPEWQGEVSKEIIDLTTVLGEINSTEALKATIYDNFIKPLQDKIDTIKGLQLNALDNTLKELGKKENDLRNEVQKMDVNNYYNDNYRITVYKKTEQVLADDCIETHSYSDYPELYKDPEPKLKEFKKRFGTDNERNIVKITMEEPDAD